MRSFQTELFSCFLPSAYAGRVNLAAAKHWRNSKVARWRHCWIHYLSCLQFRFCLSIVLYIMITRCSMRETRETALLHVACGKPARRRYFVQSPPSATSVHAHSYIQQSGRSVKTVNAKNTKNSLIHENADANITCDFGDGDISRFRSRLPHTRPASHIVSSIIVR